MKKVISTALIVALLIGIMPVSAIAATPGTSVKVSIPTFKVTMNGQVIDNTYREYPFIVYNDITYFPMTYWDTRFLGIENNWTKENGTVIQKATANAAYKPTLINTANKKSYTATISTGKYTVMNESVNNASEQYPILSFRNVAYFPLTWDWCQKFGWNINFTTATGLIISTNGDIVSNNTSSNSNNIVNSDITLEDLQGVWQGTHEYLAGGYGDFEITISGNNFLKAEKHFEKDGSISNATCYEKGAFLISGNILTMPKLITKHLKGMYSNVREFENQKYRIANFDGSSFDLGNGENPGFYIHYTKIDKKIITEGVISMVDSGVVNDNSQPNTTQQNTAHGSKASAEIKRSIVLYTLDAVEAVAVGLNDLMTSTRYMISSPSRCVLYLEKAQSDLYKAKAHLKQAIDMCGNYSDTQAAKRELQASYNILDTTVLTTTVTGDNKIDMSYRLKAMIEDFLDEKEDVLAELTALKNSM